MRWYEIVNETESESKFQLQLGATWVKDIERRIMQASEKYDSMPTPENRSILRETLIDAKKDIEETLQKMALFDTDDRLINRIEKRYTELYVRVLNMKWY